MTTIFLDVSAIAYRSLYTTGALAYDGRPTGVLFGLFRYAKHLNQWHPGCRIVWCFDCKSTKRKEIFPQYKIKRTVDLEDTGVVQARKNMYDQLLDLRERYLPAMGYRNVFWREGYEADDVIASLCGTAKGNIVIVSSDNDLLQLLDGTRVVIESPKGCLVTEQSFRSEWYVGPDKWADVKAVAGCSSDGVVGVRGVGARTAVKYLLGTLNKKSKTYQAIIDDMPLIRRNYRLVKLPFDGVGTFDLSRDVLSEKRIFRVYRALGIRSLL